MNAVAESEDTERIWLSSDSQTLGKDELHLMVFRGLFQMRLITQTDTCTPKNRPNLTCSSNASYASLILEFYVYVLFKFVFFLHQPQCNLGSVAAVLE